MHAIVLVGGFGTRLRPLTDTTPKSMLTVGNEPIVARLMRRLETGGVTTVTLALGFLPEPFVAAFPDGRVGSVEMRYAVEPEPLDTAGAIRFAATAAGVEETFLVVNGDIITDLDVAGLMHEHQQLGAEATLHLTPVAEPSAYGVVERDNAGRVRRFVEKPALGQTTSTVVNAGTYVMERSVLDLIPEGRRVSVERETFPVLVERGGLFGVVTDDYWIDVGRPDTYLTANLDRLAGRYDAGLPVVTALGVEPGAAVDPAAQVRDSVVARDTRIGAGSRIDHSVVLAGAEIGEDVVMRHSIVMGHVGAGAVLDRVVVGSFGVVEAGQTLVGERVPASHD